MPTQESLRQYVEKLLKDVAPPSTPTPQPEEEEQEFDADAATEKIEVADKQVAHEARIIYYDRIYYIVCWWLVLLFALFAFHGVGWINIPTLALTTLAGTSTISIVGLLVLIMKYLFPVK